MTARRLLFWLITVLFVCITGWWVFYFPYSQERLYRAIPQNATFISEHGRLAERWKTISKNPLTLSLLTTAGFKYEDLNKTINDPGVQAMLDRFGEKNVVLAYVPSVKGSGKAAWVLSCWAGGNGQVFRWGTAALLPGTNLKEVRLSGGKSIWTLAKKNNPSDPDFSMAIVDGVLLICLSSDPLDVKYLLDRVEYGAPLHADLQERLAASKNIENDSTMDRGWIRWHEQKGEEDQIRRISFELSSLDAGHSEGLVSGDADLILSTPMGILAPSNGVGKSACITLGNSPGFDGLKDVLSVSPDAFLVVPFVLAEPALMGRQSSKGIRIVTRAVKSQADTNTAFFVSMFGGERSGRILGLKVPTFIAGAHVTDEARCMARVTEIIDILNAAFKLSVIPRREDFGGKPVIVVDSTRQEGVFDSLASTDKPAVTCKDKWLTISSSLDTLTNIVCRPPLNRDSGGRWASGIPRLSKDCSGYMWVDFEASSDAIRHAIAAYTLVLMTQNSGNRLDARKELALLDNWINGLKSARTAEFWLTFKGDGFQVRFEFGSAGR